MAIRLPLGILLMFFIITGCATTSLQNVWMDDKHSEKVSRVLVLGISQNKAARQIFESELARQLEAKGITAIPSFPIFPSDGVLDKQTIVATANEKNVDSVIVTKVLDVNTYNERITDVTSRGYGSNYMHSGRYNTYRRPGGWYGDYSSGYSTVRSYDYQYSVANVETSLYLLEGEVLIWTALTQTESDDDIAASINEMVTVLISQLEKDGLI